MNTIPERDWKKLRAIKYDLLDIACDRILNKIKILINNKKTGENHKTYLKLLKLIKREDKKIGIMFDDPKRSNTIQQMVELVNNNLITDEILEEFSEETRERIKVIIKIRH